MFTPLRVMLLTALVAACSGGRSSKAPAAACADCTDAGPAPAFDASMSPMDGSTQGAPDAAYDAAVLGDAGDHDASHLEPDATTHEVDCDPGELLCVGEDLAQCDEDAGTDIDIVDRCSERGLRCVDEACAAIVPGTRLWERVVSTPSIDLAEVVAVDASGTVLVSIGHNGTIYRSVLRSYDSNGRLLDEDELNGELGAFHGVDAEGDQIFVRMSPTEGLAYKELMMTRRNPAGGLRWTRMVGERWSSAAVEDVAIAPDGSVYVCLVLALKKLHVLEIDREADLVHDTDLGESSARAYCASDFAGRGIATTWRDDATPDADAWVHKLDEQGEVDWDWSLDLGGDELTMDLAADPSGNTYVAGVIYQEGAWLRKLDPNGEELWSRTLQADTTPGGLAVDPGSGDVVIAFDEVDGTGGSKLYVRKYDPEGMELWTATEGGGNVTVWASDVAIAPNGDVIVVGGKDLGGGNNYDAWIARYAR
jgi:hypothetical protein